MKESDEIMIITGIQSEGKILRTKVEALRDIGRTTQASGAAAPHAAAPDAGRALIDMEDTDRVVDVAKLAESADDEESNGANGTGNTAETNGFS